MVKVDLLFGEITAGSGEYSGRLLPIALSNNVILKRALRRGGCALGGCCD